MELYVRNSDLEIIGIVDVFTSLIWTKRYYAAGDFELYLPPTDKLLNLFVNGKYITREDDDAVMIIESLNITTDAESGNFLTVTGRSLESILARRIVWGQTTLNNGFAAALYKLVSDNAIETATERVIEQLRVNSDLSLSDPVKTQYTGDNLYTVISELCTTYGYGWKITLQDETFLFSVYAGIDHSYNQSENPFVVFSPEFDNLINSEYTLDTTNFANAALIGGEGEGTDRKYESVGTAHGLDRYEIFVDAKDVSSNGNSETPISADEYSELLKNRGIEKIAEHGVAETFEGEAESTTYEYKTAWNLGDIVQIENEFGMLAAPRIIEVIESIDSSGHKIIPTWEVKQAIDGVDRIILRDSSGYILRDSSGAILTVEG